jgi:hypothetical protein
MKTGRLSGLICLLLFGSCDTFVVSANPSLDCLQGNAALATQSLRVNLKSDASPLDCEDLKQYECSLVSYRTGLSREIHDLSEMCLGENASGDTCLQVHRTLVPRGDRNPAEDESLEDQYFCSHPEIHPALGVDTLGQGASLSEAVHTSLQVCHNIAAHTGARSP